MAQAQTGRTWRPGRELALLLAAGAAGAGIVLVATRQVLARVVAPAPRPLPASVVEVTGQDLRPALAALAVAALASLAAVLATRGVARRITGSLTVVLGAGIGFAGAGQVTAVQALSAARSVTAGLTAGAGSGTAAGSVTAGGGTGETGLSLSGLPVHVTLLDTPWRAAMLAGALLIIGSGLMIAVRARLLPAMSSRYDRPARTAARPSWHARPSMPARAGTGPGMWESLSAGEDPTIGSGGDLEHAAQSAARPAQSALQGRRRRRKRLSVRSGALGNPPEGAAEPR